MRFVTHDLREALSLADRVLFLSARPGRIVLEQPIDIAHPRDAHDAEVERLRADILERHPELLAGTAGGGAEAPAPATVA